MDGEKEFENEGKLARMIESEGGERIYTLKGVASDMELEMWLVGGMWIVMEPRGDRYVNIFVPIRRSQDVAAKFEAIRTRLKQFDYENQ